MFLIGQTPNFDYQFQLISLSHVDLLYLEVVESDLLLPVSNYLEGVLRRILSQGEWCHW